MLNLNYKPLYFIFSLRRGKDNVGFFLNNVKNIINLNY